MWARSCAANCGMRRKKRRRSRSFSLRPADEEMDARAPMDAVLPYRAMAYNNGWANHRLLAACGRLSQADFVATRTGFFPSLRATLNHILIIDRYYVDAMEGGSLGPAAWANPEPCEAVVELRKAQMDVDRRLIAVVERLGPADLTAVVAVHRGKRI